jgi:hypothetical protein
MGCTNKLNILTTLRSAHTVFVCFVLVWEETDLCHSYHKLIGFITEMKNVYSAVWTGPLNEVVCVLSFKG